MRLIVLFLCLVCLQTAAEAYPIDGYYYTGIRRLINQRRVMEDSIAGRRIPFGALKYRDQIKLNLADSDQSFDQLATTDKAFEDQILSLLPNLDKSYSVSIMDITPGRKVRYAERQPLRQFQPGSVGKLAIITGLFTELARLYPDDFEKRMILLKNHKVKANTVGIPDHHTVPFYDVDRERFYKRHLQSRDEFSLFEWADHVMSVSSNGAASVVWREVIYMRAFGDDYPVSEEVAENWVDTVDRRELARIARGVVNDPLRELGITEDEWRLGSLFTRTGKQKFPAGGGSTGTPRGLMKWMVALEKGDIVDKQSSLEFKRLMYMTDRRIRYARSNALDSAAVYFKSGSFYKCDRSRNPNCGKYRGNVYNYMNSVCMVEQPDGTTYLVALMTNVLSRNSGYDHYILARRFDNAVRSFAPPTDEPSEAEVMKVVDGGERSDDGPD